jgi:hypothetical protein
MAAVSLAGDLPSEHSALLVHGMHQTLIGGIVPDAKLYALCSEHLERLDDRIRCITFAAR